MKDKSTIREEILRLLKEQGSNDRLIKSQQIAQQLYALPAFLAAKTVMFYASSQGEVETFEMMQQAMQLRKKIALPNVLKNQKKMIPTLTNSLESLKKGSYGILEPDKGHSKELDVSEIDMIIVPGIAFDARNNRLGRGAGYYDRFLCSLDDRTVTVGLAYDFQIVDRLPVEQHDVALDCVLSA